MKLLLDECVPRRFCSSLSSDQHQCLTVPEAGFAGKTNGELIALAEASFDVFITLDKGFAYEQNLTAERSPLFLFSPSQLVSRICFYTHRPAAMR